METYLSMYIVNSIALIFLLYYIYGDKFLDMKRKKDFSLSIIFVILMMVLELGTLYVSYENANIYWANQLFNTIGFMLTPIIPLFLMTIFDTNILKKYKWIYIPTLVNIIFSLLSPFLNFIFSINQNNIYERGPLFFIFVIVYIINILTLAFVVWHNSKNRLQPIKNRLIILSIFTIIGSLVQIHLPHILLSWHIVTASLFLLYIILSDFEGNFDSLTHLYNRFAFVQKSKKIEQKKSYSIIIFDIDHFKQINDTYGHHYGDMVLKEVALLISNVFKESGDCFRVGGDEFCVLCQDLNQDNTLKTIHLFKEKLGVMSYKDIPLPSISIGYGHFKEDHNLDFKKVMRIADDRMYESKNKLRNP